MNCRYHSIHVINWIASIHEYPEVEIWKPDVSKRKITRTKFFSFAFSSRCMQMIVDICFSHNQFSDLYALRKFVVFIKYSQRERYLISLDWTIIVDKFKFNFYWYVCYILCSIWYFVSNIHLLLNSKYRIPHRQFVSRALRAIAIQFSESSVNSYCPCQIDVNTSQALDSDINEHRRRAIRKYNKIVSGNFGINWMSHHVTFNSFISFGGIRRTIR